MSRYFILFALPCLAGADVSRAMAEYRDTIAIREDYNELKACTKSVVSLCTSMGSVIDDLGDMYDALPIGNRTTAHKFLKKYRSLKTRFEECQELMELSMGEAKASVTHSGSRDEVKGGMKEAMTKMEGVVLQLKAFLIHEFTPAGIELGNMLKEMAREGQPDAALTLMGARENGSEESEGCTAKDSESSPRRRSDDQDCEWVCVYE